MSFPQFLIALPAFPPLCCPSFLSLFLPLPLPLRHRNLPQALHLSGLSACFFIWLVATGGSTLADYNSAASHFRFIRAPASPPPTHTLLASSLSLYPTSASILTTLTSVSPDNTAIPHHTAAVRTSTLPSCLPPSISSTSISAENLAPEPRDEKEKEVGEERNIVAVEAFKLERQLELYYYLGLCHW